MGQRRPEQVMVCVDLILGRSAISKFKFGIPRGHSRNTEPRVYIWRIANGDLSPRLLYATDPVPYKDAHCLLSTVREYI